ncbi:hypothetical protein H5V43_11020 [Sphingobium fuliginis]|jgi:hypothetical protein|uniref:Transmembrane anchor protein n=1 Tax=Sphingobium fuliginis (strain ATCC 27551) TaxID=336203 RepID=A0A7M2GEM3_SPHSA|nr:hypothetical protein [Sphingobium fuliginis]QOT70667.1 hypothetical protein H5V43_11020 [Sphingobium fuliginis]
MTATTSVAAPYRAQPATLWRAALAAGVAGAAILLLFVLPAEYGVDVTGVGRAIGLTAMAGDQDAAEPAEAAGPPPAPAAYTVPPQTQASIAKATAFRSDTKTITLAPHSGMEIKARMKVGDTFNFRWTATGPVRADMHGEPIGGKEDEFTDYWKQKDIKGAQGSFTAPFAGTHGWYWKNREDVPVTITVKTDGFYETLFERT